MRHPQKDLLIIYALVLLAREYRGKTREEEALNLAAEIAEEHGLTVADAVCQLE